MRIVMIRFVHFVQTFCRFCQCIWYHKRILFFFHLWHKHTWLSDNAERCSHKVSLFISNMFFLPFFIHHTLLTSVPATARNLRWPCHAGHFVRETRSESNLHPASFCPDWMSRLTLRRNVSTRLGRTEEIIDRYFDCALPRHIRAPIQLKRREQKRTLERRCWFEFVIRAYIRTYTGTGALAQSLFIYTQ